MRLNRRRFLTIAATAAGLAATPFREGRAAPLREWRGTALGAEARILLHHDDAAHAHRLIAACLDEIERLEGVFSLYRPDSAISRLNRDGALEAPPVDFVVLLAEALRISRLSEGAFDPTVQPLWDLFARHFADPAADPGGPSAAAVATVRERVGWRHVAAAPDRVAFARPGMALTLNGIAQGYITDRVADLLRRAGLDRVLVDLGEIRALGEHPERRPWRVELAAPHPAGLFLEIADRAVATSSGAGTRFSPACHHLFDPRTGRSAGWVEAVSVEAPTATAADALSTALAVAPPERAAALLRHAPDARAWITTRAGTLALGV